MGRIFGNSKLTSQIGIGKYYKNRNKILVYRGVGGLGDILMHRMMFEDFKKTMPDSEIIFACPAKYITAADDHPYIDQVVDCKEINRNDFHVKYETTEACMYYESKIAPKSDKHRSDIWANHCGIELKNHNMHLHLTHEQIEFGVNKIESLRKSSGPVVLISPVSAMTTKNLLDYHCSCIVNYLRNRNCNVIAMHSGDLPIMNSLGVDVVSKLSIKEWMGIVNAVDYVISVDTSTFHLAGGLGKPLMGIFTFADGKVYGKYFDFVLVQKHRDDGNWDCGPCYVRSLCPKIPERPHTKPCLTQIDASMLESGLEKMFNKWPIEHK